jgi:uncharacterized repeat protein (TIGR02543 family)
MFARPPILWYNGLWNNKQQFFCKFLIIFFIVIFAGIELTACGMKNNEDNNDNTVATYTVTFDSKGGSAVDPVITNKDFLIVLPTAPTLIGYVFDGWYFDDGVYNEQLTGNTKINGNLTAYAKWNSQTVDTDWTYTVNEGKATITGFTNTTATSVAIPSIINTFPVTAIAENVFKDRTILREVFLPDGIITIGYYAFSGCNSLTTANIPQTATTIGYYAFFNCTSLINITLPDTLIGIGGYAFYGCSSLTNITIPNNIKSIGTLAFNNCTNLTEINYNATNMNDLTSIDSEVFYNIGTNTIVNIGANVMKIPAYLFCRAIRIKVVNFTEDSVCSNISNFAFYGCNSLTDIDIPSSVTSIGISAFNSCTNLASIIISNGVTAIGDLAFTGCDSLRSIIIPDSVTIIGEQAFLNFTELTIYVEVSSKPNGWDTNWNNGNRPVYWVGEWHIDDNGFPVANVDKMN